MRGQTLIVLIAFGLSLSGLLSSCAKRYELGLVSPRPFDASSSTLTQKKAMLFINSEKLKDRYENFELGLDFRGIHALVGHFFQQKFDHRFAQFTVSLGEQAISETHFLLYPTLEINPTDDGPLAKDLVIKFTLIAQDASGRKLAERNMEKRLHYASTTKAEIEQALGQAFDEVSEDLYLDLNKIR